MDRQTSLFDSPAVHHHLAANADPGTSHASAKALKQSGLHAAQKLAVLNALRSCGHPKTSRELAAIADLDRHMVARRLPDLEKEGLAVRVGVRACEESYTSANAQTWRAVR